MAVAAIVTGIPAAMKNRTSSEQRNFDAVGIGYLFLRNWAELPLKIDNQLRMSVEEVQMYRARLVL